MTAFMTEPLLLALRGDMLQVQMPTGRASSPRDPQCSEAQHNMDHVSQDDALMAHSKKRIHKVFGRAAALCNPMLFGGAVGTCVLGCGSCWQTVDVLSSPER